VIRFNLCLIPWATRCHFTEVDLHRTTYLSCYLFGVRVARFHLNR